MSAPWWTLDSERSRCNAVVKSRDRIEGLSSGRRNADVLHMRLYGNRDVSGAGKEVKWREGDTARLRYNLCQAICDALQAKIAKLRPRPRFLTDRGNWAQRKRAEAMEQAVDGEFYRNDMDRLGPAAFLDGAVTGTGALKVVRDGSGFPRVERTVGLELLVDPRDGYYGKPRTLFHCRAIDREVLMARLPESADLIRKAPSATKESHPFIVRDSDVDQVVVTEGWHLPTSSGAGDGARVLCLDSGELDFGEWERDHFPFAFFPWHGRQYGFWGRGVVEEIKPLQIELNHVLEKIQYILHNVSTVRHWAQEGTEVRLRAQRMTNTPGEILFYRGAQPPITDARDAVPPELLRHAEFLIQKAFAQVGLSELSATSQKPAGLNSGEAIRSFQDIGTERFVLAGRDYEEAHMDVARLIVEEKRDIAADPDEEERPIRVPTKAKRGRGETVRTIKWGEAGLAEEDYILKVLPQSALPGTPTGRIATVEGWIASGLISPEDGRELLDFPDLATSTSLSQAARDAILSAIHVMIEDGEYVTPGPMMDLEMAMPLVAAAYNRHQWEGAPEAHLELLTRFNDDAERMLADAAQPAPQQPAQGPDIGAALPQGAVQPAPVAAA